MNLDITEKKSYKFRENEVENYVVMLLKDVGASENHFPAGQWNDSAVDYNDGFRFVVEYSEDQQQDDTCACGGPGLGLRLLICGALSASGGHLR